MYLHPLKIGNVMLKNNILLAPMAGITDLPFRVICEKFEPGLVFSEMVSSKAIFYGDEKTKKLMNLIYLVIIFLNLLLYRLRKIIMQLLKTK